MKNEILQVPDLGTFLVQHPQADMTDTEHQGELVSLLMQQSLAHLLETVGLPCINHKPETQDSFSFCSAMYTYRSDLLACTMSELSLNWSF